MDINFPFNGVTSDVYIGTSAGKMVQEHIDNAQSRIVVFSPYVDSEMIDALSVQKKYKPNLKINVYTSFDDEIKKAKRYGKSNSIFKQLEQGFKADPVRRNQQFWLRATSYAVLALMTVTLLIAILSIDDRSFGLSNLVDVLSLKNFLQHHVFGLFESVLLELGLFIILSMLAKEFKTGSYQYRKLLDFSLFLNPHMNKANRDELLFLHAKIYLIDQVVFVGSVNFTRSGFNDSVETRIKVTDSRFIQYIERFLVEVTSQKIWIFEEEKIRKRLLKEGIIHEHPNRPSAIRPKKRAFGRWRRATGI